MFIEDAHDFQYVDTITNENKTYFSLTDIQMQLGYAKGSWRQVQDICKDFVENPQPNGTAKKFVSEEDVFRIILQATILAAARYKMWLLYDIAPRLLDMNTTGELAYRCKIFFNETHDSTSALYAALGLSMKHCGSQPRKTRMLPSALPASETSTCVQVMPG